MSALAWLNSRPDGLGGLSKREQELIFEFAIVWTYFEATVMGKSANAAKLVDLANELNHTNQIDMNPLLPMLQYFRERYVQSSEEKTFTHNYEGLLLRKNDQISLVNSVLLGEKDAVVDVLAVLLIIVLRFRNNLFHGEKWVYRFEGQQRNFEIAICLLISVIDMKTVSKLSNAP
ncbi:MAG: hypothetical protein Q7K57_47160 [Burkholderiaceae bacterium]|nr:hypothetical protein [Burkholderiaceae bacterium]